jgi:hypothetical protein
MKIDPIKTLTEAIRNNGIFKHNKKLSKKKSLAVIYVRLVIVANG